jgi:hypothetical protein
MKIKKNAKKKFFFVGGDKASVGDIPNIEAQL